jgi:predicted cobalt transporter CbtA
MPQRNTARSIAQGLLLGLAGFAGLALGIAICIPTWVQESIVI